MNVIRTSFFTRFIQTTIILLVVFSYVPDSGAIDSSPLRVGAVLSLSGGFASIGREMQRGMLMAVSEHKNIKVVFEDDQSLETLATITAVNKLIATDAVSLLFIPSVDNALPVLPIVQRARIPTVVLWDNTSHISSFYPFIFASGYSPEIAGKKMARFAVQTKHLKRLAIVAAEGEWAERISDAFASEAGSQRGTIHTRERVALTESDFRSLIAKLRAAEIEAIYLPVFFSALTSFITQARAGGLHVPLLIPDAMALEDQNALGTNHGPIYMTKPWLENEEFARRYTAQFGTPASNTYLAYAAIGYDAINYVAKMQRELKSRAIETSSETLRLAMKSFRYTGLLGPCNFISSNSSVKEDTLVELRAGRLYPIGKAAP
jgi:branched-chain amino acid transport system substrate-binding protein